ncbi:MAG: crossover junction endodeoxyribonuclease RuvC [Chitinophagales bacterium]|nr:crossover junction endodeoxyribonuclease RuvC [Bacteroidota bacterium]MCB9256981.1 crossover junction endodeoxyribonuclease RuvC [Chitinophagales bacterium]
MHTKETIILGIDPGTNIFGYGVIRILDKKIELIALGSVDLSKYDNHQLKLKYIFERVRYLVDEYKPDHCAIEAPFFGKNVQSMLKLGRAQGVSMAAVLTRDIPIEEYSPRKVKQAITGNGNSSKEQVAAMLQTICKFKELPKNLDATDGLAVAICHHFQSSGKINTSTKAKDWSAFVKANPNRIKG